MGMQLFRHKTKKLKFKILVPAFLAMHLGLALFMTEASAAQEMPSDWAVPEYEEAIDEGYIIDELTNGFDEAITREAFTKLIIKTYEKIMGEIVNITQEDNPFTDTECMEVIKAYRMGIITGVDKNTFAPDERITREQLIVILVRMNRAIEIRSDKRILKYRNIDLEFGDVDLVEDWAYESFQIGVYNGLISGIGSNLLGPDNETTIEQAIVLNLRLAKFVEAYDEELVYDVAVASASEIQGQSGSVTVDILNMRSTPDLSSSANIIRKLKLNEEVTLLEKVGDWYHIYASGGLEGYVYCDYIRILGPDMEPSELVAEIIAYAKQFRGTPYLYAGTSLTRGVDCSSFTQQVMAPYGISLSRSSSGQYSNGVAVGIDDLEPGDLIYYGYSGRVSHVALYIGGGEVIHANTTYGVSITPAFGWMNKPVIGYRRVIS